MNIPLKSEVMAAASPPIQAVASEPVVVVLPLKRLGLKKKVIGAATGAVAGVVPPFIVIGVVMAVWELICRQAGSTLPPPSKLLRDTRELIFDPFFDRGGIDKGLFWHLSASLQPR